MKLPNPWPVLLLTLLGAIAAAGAGAGERPGAVSLQALDRQIDQALYEAINGGAELYNKGDPAGCCRYFEGALVSLRPVLAHRPALQKVIVDGLAMAGGIGQADARARQMRTVLDALREGLRPAPAKSGQPSGEKLVPGGLVLSARERALLDLTNHERARQKLPPLRANAQLFAAARKHSAKMAGQDKMAHELDGQSPRERMQAAGYVASNWGENIAAGYPSGAEAMAAWMGSEGHRRNILDPDFTEIGLGIVANQRGELFYTQVFGSPWRPLNGYDDVLGQCEVDSAR